jgi:hypothetical protein
MKACEVKDACKKCICSNIFSVQLDPDIVVSTLFLMIYVL